jgi:hypothetical protein
VWFNRGSNRAFAEMYFAEVTDLEVLPDGLALQGHIAI